MTSYRFQLTLRTWLSHSELPLKYTEDSNFLSQEATVIFIKDLTTATHSWLVLLCGPSGPCSWSRMQQLELCSIFLGSLMSLHCCPPFTGFQYQIENFHDCLQSQEWTSLSLPYGYDPESICSLTPSSFRNSSASPTIPQDTWKTSIQTAYPGTQMVAWTGCQNIRTLRSLQLSAKCCIYWNALFCTYAELNRSSL